MILSIARYDSLEGGGPMQTLSSASSTCRAFLSASEYTATVAMPILRAVLMTRQAISPRLAIRIFLNMMASEVVHCGLAELAEPAPFPGSPCFHTRCAPAVGIAQSGML